MRSKGGRGRRTPDRFAALPDFSSSFFDYPTAGADGLREQLTFLPDRTPEDWAVLLDHTETLRFSAGEEVIREGESDRSLYLLTAGSLVARAGARNFKMIESPSVVGEVAFLDGGTRSVTLRAAGEVELNRLSMEAFDVLAARHPELARAILFDLGRIVAARLRVLTDSLGRA